MSERLTFPLPIGTTSWRAALPHLAARLQRLSARGVFVALALPVGLFLVFAIPPFQGLDEPNQFYRVYSITSGAMVEPILGGNAGAVLPACLQEYAHGLGVVAARPGRFHPHDFLRVPDGCSGRPSSFASFGNTALYSPVSYLPQIVGVGIARWLGASIPLMFYAGRTAAFLAYVALVSLALTIAPRGHLAIAVVALMPASLTLGTQFSADAMTIAYALLLFAAVVRCCFEPAATWRSFMVAAAAAAALALSKSSYFALAPLLLLVPARLFPSTWWALAAKVGTLGVIAVLVGLWYLQVRGVSLYGPAGAGIIDTQRQLSFIRHHPLWYARFVVLTLLGPQTAYFTWQGFVSWVGFNRTATAGSPAPPPLVMVAGIGLVFLAYAREAPRALVVSAATAARALLPAALVVVNAFLMVTSLYLIAVPVGASNMWLQGRYFLPLAAVPLLSLLALQAGPEERRAVLPLVPLVVLMLTYLVFKVAIYFYA